MKIASADVVRATFARLLLGSDPPAPRLGAIELHPHQRDGVRRVLTLLERHGGALLADDVGTGKTYIACGVMRAFSSTVVLAPARLRDMWGAAARAAGVTCRFASLEALSRGHTEAPADLVVVDEAHHLRTPGTRRFRQAAATCANARVLLLSATPVQNRVRDLRAILSLFVGHRAWSLPEQELAGFVVRRDGASPETPTPRLPRVADPRWIAGGRDVDCLDRLLALPRPVPPRDGDDGGILLTYSLARQWSSSRAALTTALRRRLAKGLAMQDSLERGVNPSRAELAAWSYAEGVQQLAFPELLAAPDPASSALLDAVGAHLDGIRDFLAWLRASDDPDHSRAVAIRALCDSHPDERIVAFSEFTETVASMYRLLAPGGRVAMLTHAGGRVAGGAISRRELLDRFAPGASQRIAARDRVDLLLTTDVLSEGVNLQDASVVVHLDLAWNPARMRQRVGRLRRIGAARDSVSVYAMSPPAPAERLLALERRLAEKTLAAARTVGVAGSILPGMPEPARPSSDAAREERIASIVRRWSGDSSAIEGVAAAVQATRSGALACVSTDGRIDLVAVLDGRITRSRAIVEDLLTRAGDCDHPIAIEAITPLARRLELWLRRRKVTDVIDLPSLRIGQSRRLVLKRLETIAGRTPRHARVGVAPLVHAARCAAAATLSAGAERVLDELARSPLEDQAWLRAIGEFAALHSRPRHADRVLGVLLLVSTTFGSSARGG